jgi:hypothetical protein
MGGVEVVKTPLQEGVYHLGGLGNVHLVADHGQTHTAKAEILFDFREPSIHIAFLLFVYFHNIISYVRGKVKHIILMTPVAAGIVSVWRDLIPLLPVESGILLAGGSFLIEME